MAHKKVDKNTILGISLVVFISLLLFLSILPAPGFDGWIYHAQDIDSIHVRYSEYSYTPISDRAKIAVISAEIKNCKPVEVKKIKLSKFPFALIFYSGKRKSILDFLDGSYDGKVICGGRVYYRNDKLWELISTDYPGN
jgi:hypothetical protein